MSGDDRPLGLHLDDDRPLPEARCACGWVGAASLAEGHRCDLPEPDDAEQGECEVCTEVRQDPHVEVLEHLVFATGPVHILRWAPPGWSTEFGLEIAVVITVGLDEAPLGPDEATLVAHALLAAAGRAGR